MKKILWIIPLLFIVAGCSNDEYQVSDLKISSGTPYIEGVFKNNSDTDCKYVLIQVEVSSGTFPGKGCEPSGAPCVFHGGVSGHRLSSSFLCQRK